MDRMQIGRSRDQEANRRRSSIVRTSPFFARKHSAAAALRGTAALRAICKREEQRQNMLESELTVSAADVTSPTLAGSARNPLRGLIVGQAPSGRASDEHEPPLSGLAERRLARLAGVSVDTLWERFDRKNVLAQFPGRKARTGVHARANYVLHGSTGDCFPLEEARRAAQTFPCDEFVLVVLLGLNVARAFGFPRPALFARRQVCVDGRKQTWLVLPHPSGVSHFWNRPENVCVAASHMRGAMAMAGVFWTSSQQLRLGEHEEEEEAEGKDVLKGNAQGTDSVTE
jgi:hypothetical protein